MAWLTMATVEPEEVEDLLLLKKRKRNMAEGPSTTATPSNQFVVKCSVCSRLLYKCIWSLCLTLTNVKTHSLIFLLIIPYISSINPCTPHFQRKDANLHTSIIPYS